VEIEKLIWDRKVQEKIAKRHRLSYREVEEVFEGNYQIRRSGNLYHAYGQSTGGRYLFVVFLYLGKGRVQVVAARDMTQKEHRLYRREKGREGGIAMAAQKPRTKKRLPEFGKMSLEEIDEFWETHDSADYWDQMEDVTDQVTFKHPVEKIVSIRIAEGDLKELKRLASERGLGHTTLIRTWIKEKLHEELRAAQKA